MHHFSEMSLGMDVLSSLLIVLNYQQTDLQLFFRSKLIIEFQSKYIASAPTQATAFHRPWPESAGETLMINGVQSHAWKRIRASRTYGNTRRDNARMNGLSPHPRAQRIFKKCITCTIPLCPLKTHRHRASEWKMRESVQTKPTNIYIWERAAALWY